MSTKITTCSRRLPNGALGFRGCLLCTFSFQVRQLVLYGTLFHRRLMQVGMFKPAIVWNQKLGTGRMRLYGRLDTFKKEVSARVSAFPESSKVGNRKWNALSSGEVRVRHVVRPGRSFFLWSSPTMRCPTQCRALGSCIACLRSSALLRGQRGLWKRLRLIHCIHSPSLSMMQVYDGLWWFCRCGSKTCPPGDCIVWSYWQNQEDPTSDAVHRAGSVLRYVAEKRCPELGLQGAALLQGAASGRGFGLRLSQQNHFVLECFFTYLWFEFALQEYQ